MNSDLLPETKRKTGLWIAVLVIGIIFLIVVSIKKGTSTQDPQKAVVDAASAERTAAGEQTSESTQVIADHMISEDGTSEAQKDPTEAGLKSRIRRNLELAEDEQLSRDKGINLPSSVDANGRPTRTVSYDTANTTTDTADKPITIPNPPEGWDPEREIIVPAANGYPAYRYTPAYLRGSNNHYQAADIAKRDSDWLKSIGLPSYGRSVAANNTFNQGLVDKVVVKQSVHGSQTIRISGYKCTNQPGDKPILKTNVQECWTIPAPDETK